MSAEHNKLNIVHATWWMALLWSNFHFLAIEEMRKLSYKNVGRSEMFECWNDIIPYVALKLDHLPPFSLFPFAHVFIHIYTKCANAYASIGSYFRNSISQHIPKLSDNIHDNRCALVCLIFMPIQKSVWQQACVSNSITMSKEPNTVFCAVFVVSIIPTQLFHIFPSNLCTRRTKELEIGGSVLLDVCMPETDRSSIVNVPTMCYAYSIGVEPY